LTEHGTIAVLNLSPKSDKEDPMDDPMLFARKTLPSGLRVFHQRRRTAMVHCTLIIGAGFRHAPEGKEELPHVTEHAIKPGIGGYPQDLSEINAWFAGKGWIEPYLGETEVDYVRANLRAPAHDLEKLFAFIDALYRHSSIAEEELQRHIADVINERRAIHTRSERRSTRASQETFYGDLRMAAIIANDSRIEDLGIADVRDFHARHYECPNMTLVVVGDVSRREVFEMAERCFPPGRPNFIAPTPPTPRSPRPAKRTVSISQESKNKPDRTRIWYSWIIPPGGHDEVTLAEHHIYKELFHVLREEMSAAYKINWNNDAYQCHRLVVMGVDVAPERQRAVRRAINVILRDAQRFAKALPRLKDYHCLNELLGKRDLSPEETVDAAVADINVFGKPISYAERERRIRAISERKALRSYATLFDPNRALIEVHDEI